MLLHFLGPYPKDWRSKFNLHGNTKKMPPIGGSKRFVCQKADLHSGYVSQGQRQTHVLEDCNCSFQCTIRYFEEVENLAVLSFVKGEHIHTCSTQRDNFVPLKPSELLFILKGLAQSGSVQEFYRQEFAPQLKARMEKGEGKQSLTP